MSDDPKRSGPVGLVVLGLLLIALVGLLLFVPTFKCPPCRWAYEAATYGVSHSPDPAFKRWQAYALNERPCGYCDQRRRVTLPVWYQAKNRR